MTGDSGDQSWLERTEAEHRRRIERSPNGYVLWIRQPFRRILDVGAALLAIYGVWNSHPPVIVTIAGGIGAAMALTAALAELGVRLYLRRTARRVAPDAFGANRE